MTPRKRSANLTEPEIKVLQILEDYYNKNGYPPSIRDILTAGKFSSTSVVNYYLNQLETSGHIERSGRVSRGIRMLKPFSEIAQGPRVGGEGGQAAARDDGRGAAHPRAGTHLCLRTHPAARHGWLQRDHPGDLRRRGAQHAAGAREG